MTDAQEQLMELEGRIAALKIARFKELFINPIEVKLNFYGYWLDGEWASCETPITINPDGTWSYA